MYLSYLSKLNDFAANTINKTDLKTYPRTTVPQGRSLTELDHFDATYTLLCVRFKVGSDDNVIFQSLCGPVQPSREYMHALPN